MEQKLYVTYTNHINVVSISKFFAHHVLCHNAGNLDVIYSLKVYLSFTLLFGNVLGVIGKPYHLCVWYCCTYRIDTKWCANLHSVTIIFYIGSFIYYGNINKGLKSICLVIGLYIFTLWFEYFHGTWYYTF